MYMLHINVSFASIPDLYHFYTEIFRMSEERLLSRFIIVKHSLADHIYNEISTRQYVRNKNGKLLLQIFRNNCLLYINSEHCH